MPASAQLDSSARADGPDEAVLADRPSYQAAHACWLVYAALNLSGIGDGEGCIQQQPIAACADLLDGMAGCAVRG